MEMVRYWRMQKHNYRLEGVRFKGMEGDAFSIQRGLKTVDQYQQIIHHQHKKDLLPQKSPQ